jgi:ribosomal protein S17
MPRRVLQGIVVSDKCDKTVIGDSVRIIESKPISKTKKWVVEPKNVVEGI